MMLHMSHTCFKLNQYKWKPIFFLDWRGNEVAFLAFFNVRLVLFWNIIKQSAQHNAICSKWKSTSCCMNSVCVCHIPVSTISDTTPEQLFIFVNLFTASQLFNSHKSFFGYTFSPSRSGLYMIFTVLLHTCNIHFVALAWVSAPRSTYIQQMSQVSYL